MNIEKAHKPFSWCFTPSTVHTHDCHFVLVGAKQGYRGYDHLGVDVRLCEKNPSLIVS